jgi:hypothetical protein
MPVAIASPTTISPRSLTRPPPADRRHCCPRRDHVGKPCAGGAWHLSTRRRRWSVAGTADELATGRTSARFDQAFRVGGGIVLDEERFTLRLPFLRDGWWLRGADRRPVAVLHEQRNVSDHIELREGAGRVGARLGLVLLFALWATWQFPRGTVDCCTGWC